MSGFGEGLGSDWEKESVSELSFIPNVLEGNVISDPLNDDAGNESDYNNKALQKADPPKIKKYENKTKSTKKKEEQDKKCKAENIFLYKPGIDLPDLSNEYMNQQIQILIPIEKIWGLDPYCSNSDAVQNLKELEKLKNYEAVCLNFKVKKPRKQYNTALKNDLLSRNVQRKEYLGNSLKCESYDFLQTIPKLEELTSFAKKMANVEKPNKQSQAFQNIQPIPETHIVFNMNFEPAYKYSLFNIQDQDYEDTKSFLSYRLKDQTLYLETIDKEIYEIAQNEEQQHSQIEDQLFNDLTYRVSLLSQPEEKNNRFFQVTDKIPLAQSFIKILHKNQDWRNLIWGDSHLEVTKDFTIKNIQSFKLYLNK